MHILIIPDGNRRWAKLKNLAAFIGHKHGAERFNEITEALFEKQQIEFLTFWVLSKDNLEKRPKEEVEFLLDILEQQLLAELKSSKYEEFGIRFRAIGLWKKYFTHRPNLMNLILDLENKTVANSKHNLTMLLAYDGFIEMEDAIKKLASDKINFENIHKSLWTHELPLVDGIVRTGVEGDPHNSGGVMMWLTGNSQYVFLETKFPDFTGDLAVDTAVNLKSRIRRLGK
jgi:undecaprenyl diphosphate synthase